MDRYSAGEISRAWVDHIPIVWVELSMVVEKCRCMVVEKCRSRAVIRPQLLASGLASPPSFSMISNLPRSL